MPARNRRLGTKLTAILVAYLLVAIVAVGLTLLTSWKLEGGAAAVNDLGSQRMRSYRIALLVSQAARPDAERDALAPALHAEIAAFDRVLDDVARGDPSRPLLLPQTTAILADFAALRDTWHAGIRPRLERLLAASGPAAYLALERQFQTEIARFVPQIDALVRAIEADMASNTHILRLLQFGLIALSVVGTVALVYLMYLLIIRPVANLASGMQRMEARDFSVRLPVETRDEFGALAAGFNSMAGRLQELYAGLERRVEEKTRTLEARNRELGTLYETAALLAQPEALEALCRSFVRKVVARLAAHGGAVRLVEPGSGRLHLFVQEGMPDDLAQAERCLQKNECLCGEGVKRSHPSVHILVNGAYRTEPYRCREAGFATVGVFPIRFGDQSLGVFNLYYREPRDFTADERHMLETLGQHLGLAVQTQRLAAREKEMAISEERNLLAQELHDSIAQSLAFLNIQAQLLEDALAKREIENARAGLAQIRAGIQESYDDVRELLVHFRTRMAESDVETAIAALLLRFEQQTGIDTKFSQSGLGLPLSPEAQLQAMHIVQESLSNARKHAAASCVEVDLQRGAIYRLRIRDNGRGFDPAAVPGDLHVGLRIMRERARRIGGELEIRSAPGSGTEIVLNLPVLQAQAA